MNLFQPIGRRLTASLVLYHNDASDFGPAIQSFLDGSDGSIVVVDNSAIPLKHPLFQHDRVTYIFAGRNLGFGAGHNRGLATIARDSDLHLFLNPDVTFGCDVLPCLVGVMADNGIAAAMPRITFPDGSLQRLAKLLPTPVDLILRRFVPVASVRKWINDRYELSGLRQDAVVDVPSLSGCFLLLQTKTLLAIGGFDERYFMYMEDVDLVRRVGDIGRTVYVPIVSVVHGYAKGSYGNGKLLRYHISSAIAYFQKWGWAFDGVRRRRNAAVMALARASKPLTNA